MRKLLPRSMMVGLEPTAANDKMAAVDQPKEGDIVKNRMNCYSLDKEKKRFVLWIYGPMFHTSHYKKAISIMHTLTPDYITHIVLHTPGGSIATACNILSAMERCKAKIITHNVGEAASCGSLILAFGDKINIHPFSVTMFHNALFGNYDSVHRLLTQTQHTIRNTMDLFSKMQKRGVITAEEIEKIVKRGEEFYLTSDVMTARVKDAGLWYEGGYND